MSNISDILARSKALQKKCAPCTPVVLVTEERGKGAPSQGAPIQSAPSIQASRPDTEAVNF
jgi:hypothetical protein